MAMKSSKTGARVHHRTTILTVSHEAYRDVRRAKKGAEVACEAVNDIVSSCRGGRDAEHHKVRRSALLRRQYKGGYSAVKVRTDGKECIDCRIVGLGKGGDDECSFGVTVARR